MAEGIQKAFIPTLTVGGSQSQCKSLENRGGTSDCSKLNPGESDLTSCLHAGRGFLKTWRHFLSSFWYDVISGNKNIRPRLTIFQIMLILLPIYSEYGLFYLQEWIFCSFSFECLFGKNWMNESKWNIVFLKDLKHARIFSIGKFVELLQFFYSVSLFLLNVYKAVWELGVIWNRPVWRLLWR